VENIMFRVLAFILLLVMVAGCGEIRGQYHKVVSPDEIETGWYYCTTILTIPVLCGVHVKTEITIRIVDIVIEVIERIVIEERIKEVEKIVEVEKIAREVYVIYREKEVDIPVIVAEVIRRVKQALPPAQIRQDIDVPTVVAEVSQAVIESTPYTESGEVEHHVSTPKRKRVSIPQVNPTPITPPLQDNPTPVTPIPERGEYVVYSYINDDGSMRSGVVHGDYVKVEGNMIIHTGGDGEVDAGDTSREYVKVETGLTYEEASERAPEILTE
jgi:hypothetical protein